MSGRWLIPVRKIGNRTAYEVPRMARMDPNNSNAPNSTINEPRMARMDPNNSNAPNSTINVTCSACKNLNDTIASLMSRITRLEDEAKRIRKTVESNSFDPIRRYGKNEKPDYSNWTSEDECLASTDRIPDVDKYNDW